jgi:hypothetical protein
VLHEVKTEHQHLVIFKNATWGTVLMLDGVCQLTTSDEFIYHEMMAHVPLMALDKPKRVLVVGGGDGGVMREVLKHPTIEKAMLCEIDREVIDTALKYYPEIPGTTFDDERTVVVIADGRKFVAETDDVRRDHRRFVGADRAERGVAHAGVFRRLQAGTEGRRHPGHPERAAVPVSGPSRRHHRDPCLLVQALRALHVHAALLLRRPLRAQLGSTMPGWRNPGEEAHRRAASRGIAGLRY